MARASPIVNSFNAGEFSPRMDGRVDIGKYGSACRVLEGFIPVIQGPAVRRGGFRYLGEVKDSTSRTWLVRFEYNVDQAYILEFGHLYIRFWANHGQVLSAGLPYEIASPYTAADLTNADGTFALRFAPSADVVYIAHGSYAPRKLSRLSSTNWTLTTPAFAGGPFQDENITSTTVYASAATGAVTLTASASLFTAQMVGSLFQMREKSVLDVKSWEAGKAIVAGNKRHSDGKNYVALNNATTGGNKPTHNSGAAYDGDAGVQWQYTDPGFGIVLITGYTNPTTVTGTVVSPFPDNPTAQLPDNCVLVGNATTRWALAAWSDVAGWPTQVAFYRERLCFGRGTKVWQSVAGDYETFTARSNDGNITADMAITETLIATKVNPIVWMETMSSSIDALVCSTAASQYAIKSMTENQPYGTDNRTAPLISTLGSKNTPPVRVGNVLLFIHSSGNKLRDVNYDFYSNQFQSQDQSVMAEHIPQPGLLQIVHQQEPYSLIWGVRTDGVLVCMTYSREQYPDAPHGGWHRHPLGGNGIVESIAVIPAPDGSRDELWAIVRRTINGATKRYVEVMEWERRPNDDPQDSYYVDCGLTLNNTQAATLTPGATAAGSVNIPFTASSAIWSSGDVGRLIHYRYNTTDEEGVKTFYTAKARITSYLSATSVRCTITADFPSTAPIAAGLWRMTVTTISGLGHLEGQTVDILADGATHPQRTVTGGQIVLQAPASKVHVGFGFRSRLQTMRMNAGAQDGTSQGKKTQINACAIRLSETLGLQYGLNFSDMFDVDFRSALDAMDNPPPIFSGDVMVDWPGEWDTNPWICLSQPYPLPATIVALMPQVTANDRG